MTGLDDEFLCELFQDVFGMLFFGFLRLECVRYFVSEFFGHLSWKKRNFLIVFYGFHGMRLGSKAPFGS